MKKFYKILVILILILIIEIAIILMEYYSINNKEAPNFNSKSNVIILIDTTSNYLSLYHDEQLYKTYQIASGKPSTPSPTGTWKVVSKDTWGEGFGGHWMGLNVPWGKYGIHGTRLPNSIGWNSSKGCIRMRNNDIAEVYKLTPYGSTVIIWSGDYGNFGGYLRILKPGAIGADVYQLQMILKNKGYYKGTPNGIYGEYFKDVVHNFQKKNGLLVSDTIGSSFYSKLGIFLMD